MNITATLAFGTAHSMKIPFKLNVQQYKSSSNSHKLHSGLSIICW